MKIATLQLLLALLALTGCATRHPLVNTPIAKYDTSRLTANVETTRARVTSASSHVTRAQVHADEAGTVAQHIESEGTLAHSAQAQTLVGSLTTLQLELKSTQDDLSQALLEVSSAKAEVAATSQNLNAVHAQLVDTGNKFATISHQLDKAHDSAQKYKQWAKLEAILLGIIFTIGAGYFFLKFYLHVPFL